MADVLRARCRSVVVPFSRGGETEQTRRAGLLQDRGLAISVPEEGLTCERLAHAIDAALKPGPAPVYPSLTGAGATADLLLRLHHSRQD